MNFVQKLIEDTRNQTLDYVWKYSDGTKRYSFNLIKHPMNGLNFDAKEEDNLIIFPNGFAVEFDREDLNTLIDEIKVALKRATSGIIKDYISGSL